MKFERQPTAYTRKWVDRLNRGKWAMVALELRPNRGEVLVERLDTGVRVWVNIVRPYMNQVIRGSVWEVFKISPALPELQERQRLCFQAGDLRMATLFGAELRPPKPVIITGKGRPPANAAYLRHDGSLYNDPDWRQIYLSETFYYTELSDGKLVFCNDRDRLLAWLAEPRTTQAE